MNGLYPVHENYRVDCRRKKIVFKRENNGCMICTSHYRNKKGYPMTGYEMKPITVVKMLWLRNGRYLKSGDVMRHICDNRACINIDHIVLGTIKDNMIDRESRGRTMHGDSVRWRKISAIDAVEIYKSTPRKIFVRWWRVTGARASDEKT